MPTPTDVHLHGVPAIEIELVSEVLNEAARVCIDAGVLASLPSDELSRKEWQMHRVAGLLAARDFAGAQRLLMNMPSDSLPYQDLTEYVSFVVQRGQNGR